MSTAIRTISSPSNAAAPTKLARRLSVAAIAFAGLTLSGIAASQSPASVPAPPYVRPHTPTLGPANAKVHLVEFLDPACEGCRAFYPIVKQVIDANKNRVRLYVRYAAIHKGADYAVKALEAARAQDRYWEAMTTLFSRQSEWTRGHSVMQDKVIEVLTSVSGLDIERLKRDIQRPEYAKIVEQDLADAKALKVMQTPTFFINGKPLTEYTPEQLHSQVAAEVAAQYR
ncbi:MAG: thioredoxin domain-containing protein [Burkholderiales bacterium]